MRAVTGRRTGRWQAAELDEAQSADDARLSLTRERVAEDASVVSSRRPETAGRSPSELPDRSSILVVGPRPDSDDVLCRAFARENEGVRCERVTSRAELEWALATGVWDVVVDDRSGFVTEELLRHVSSDAVLVTAEAPVDGALRRSSESIARLSATVECEARAVRARRTLIQRLHEDDRFFELGLDLYCIATFDGRLKRVNRTWTTVLGWTEAELLATPWDELTHPDDRAAALEASRRLTEGRELVAFRNRWRCKDGSYRTVQWTATGDRSRQRIYAVAQDITRQEELEEQLLQAQKMEPVGRLAGGIAHDFNNLLTVILSATSSILPVLEEENPLRQDLEEVHEAAMRGADLTKQLLASSGRRPTVGNRVVAVSALVSDMERLLTRALGEDVELTISCDPRTGRASVDVAQVEQAMMNLAVNARDAMPNGGRLVIETANVDVTVDTAARHPGVSPGAYVTITVADTGEGMSEEVRARVFEPFYTTKAVGRGTGLGLAMVRDIMQRNGGFTTVDSTIGEGTTFTLYLPRTERAVSAPTEPPMDIERFAGSETILLVEDDRAVRARMRAGLRKSGYHVLEAENAGEALLILEEVPHVDLLLTDVVLPRFSGRQLAERMRSTRPEMKVLFMSGYDENRHRELSEKLAGTSFLQKPFTTEALMERVRSTLDARPKI